MTRGRGVGVADRFGQFQIALAGTLVRVSSGEEEVEEEPQGVDITGGGDGFAADLFGTGIAQRHGRQTPTGDLLITVSVEQPSDAEVEDFGDSFGSHEDVGGFEVPMDD